VSRSGVWVGTSPSNRGGAQAGIEPAVSAGVDVTLPRRRPPSPSQVAALPSNSAAGAVARDLEAMAERTGATRRETRRWARGCSKHAFAPAAQFRPRIKAAVCHPPSPRAQSRHQRDQLASETSVAGNDPVNGTDPLGLFGWSSITGAVHSVAHVVNQDVLPAVHTVSGVVAAAASICAVVTSETVVGGVACGAIALTAAAVNVATSDALYAEGRESGTVLALDAVGGAFAGAGSAFEAAGSLAEAASSNAQALSESWQAEMESASLFGKIGAWARSGYYGAQAGLWSDLAEMLSAGSQGAAALGFGAAGAGFGFDWFGGNSSCG